MTLAEILRRRRTIFEVSNGALDSTRNAAHLVEYSFGKYPEVLKVANTLVENVVKNIDNGERFKGLGVFVSKKKSEPQPFSLQVMDVFRRSSPRQAMFRVHKDYQGTSKLAKNQDVLVVAVLGSDVSERDAPTKLFKGSQLYKTDRRSVGCLDKKFESVLMTGKRGDVFMFDQRCYHCRATMMPAITLSCKQRTTDVSLTKDPMKHRRVLFFAVGRGISEGTLNLRSGVNLKANHNS